MSDNNNVFGKVVVDTGDIKRSKFSWNHQVSTSMDFGELQPLCCKLIKPKSKTICKGRHLVRLDPMVAPSVGSLKQKTWHHFVGMSELVRNFSAFLSKSQVPGYNNFYQPQTLPYISLCDLSAMCLIGADYSVYVHAPTSGESPDFSSTYWKLYSESDTSSEAVDIRAWLGYSTTFNPSFNHAGYPGFTGGAVDLNQFLGAQFVRDSWVPCGRSSVQRFFHRSSDWSPSVYYAWNEVALDSADYVFRHQIEVNGNSYQLAIAARLSAFGKRIRKILIGCGYRPNFVSTQNVSMLPLFAFYKAYFDSFGLTLYKSWEQTGAKFILNRYDQNIETSYGIVVTDNDDILFLDFICNELGRCYVTEDYDYISAHQSSDVVATNGTEPDKDRGWLNNIVLDTPPLGGQGVSGVSQYALTGPQSPVRTMTGHVFINRVSHTEVDAELLKILYKWTNRQTAAGKRIAELLRAAGFGKYVDEQKSNFIGYEELDIDIVDINATADSSNTVIGANSALGEYVGKGVGVTKQEDIKSFEFENDEFGYWVCMSAIVPESGFCQGMDPLNTVLSPDEFYSQEFDGVGMELEPFTIVKADSDWVNRLNTSETNRYSSSFGMVPRHTKWKVSHNIVNGDIDLRSTRSGNLPFMLDKYIDVGDRQCVLTSNSSSEFVYRTLKGLSISDLPVAGPAWRYLNRYPWLNNFVRIFADFGGDVQRWQDVVHGVLTMGNYEYTAYGKDHFNVFNWFDMVCYSGMKPISESYGTTDENSGNGDTTMSRA